MDSLFAVGFIAFLVAVNGLYVAAEFAVVGAPRAAIRRRAERGDRRARRLRRYLEDARLQDRFIATSQLGITLASLGLGMYGEHVLAEWIYAALSGFGLAGWLAAHTIAAGIAVAMLTFVHIVFGEMVPKSLALQHAERTALAVVLPVELTRLLLFPLVVGLNSLGNGILRLAGIRRSVRAQEQLYTPDELELIVEESTRDGLLRSPSGQLVRELFDFGELTAGDAMVPRVNIVGIRSGAAADEIARIIAAAPHTRYPVHDGDLDRIVGMVHVRSLLRRLRTGEPLARGDCRPLPFVPETMHLDEVLRTMTVQRTQIAVVLDEHGGTAGLLTSEDLFEEIIGDITEESAATAEVERLGEDRLLASGTARLDRIGQELGLELDHDEVRTLSGLVLSELGRPPRPGDRVGHGGIEIEVLSVAGRGVDRAEVRRVGDDRRRPGS